MSSPREKLPGFAESIVEETALNWLRKIGYQVLAGPDIAPDSANSERESYDQPLLLERLSAAIARINPGIRSEALKSAVKQVDRASFQTLVANNRQFHDWLCNGVPVESRRADGTVHGDRAFLVDFEHPEQNDWLAVNQYTVLEDHITRRADIVIFVNGLPLAVIELKNPADEHATIWTAYNQLQTYKKQITSLLRYNEALIISDGTLARIGSLTADKDRFMPWRTIEGEELASNLTSELEVLLKGVFDQRRFLDLIRYFIVFQQNGETIKIMAAYHQFHAVQTALSKTIEATRPAGDRRCGVVWHTQGSGKSLTMAFYTGRVMREPAMENPTVVVITDRNDLDEQLFTTFSKSAALFKDVPVRAGSSNDLKSLLTVPSGGVVFTTIQKFLPDIPGAHHELLSDRRNIIVIADEAHRSQYDFIDGFARRMREALPNASFIGFTGTPIEHADMNTYAVFGDCISVYDIQQAVDDHATVPIYYESRLAKLQLDPQERPKIDADFEEVTESEELEKKEKLKSRWAELEAVVGAEKRIDLVAEDIVGHWDARCKVINGKAMIVCMSRRICVELYDALAKLRPEWIGKKANGALRVVMTGSASDPVEWQDHIRTKKQREELANQFRDLASSFRMVIVRDMWLTGFDVPCLTTMYLDKPMQGHGLMQTIARVNRVFEDKPGGWIVDYLGIADELRQAVSTYTENGGKGNATVDQDAAVEQLETYYGICRDIFHGFDWSDWTSDKPEERFNIIPRAQDFVLKLDNGKQRIQDAIMALTRAYTLAVPNQKAQEIADDVSFFQTIRAAIAKSAGGGEQRKGNLDDDVKQIVSGAIVAGKVVDIFSAAGLPKPDVSILSDVFLDQVRKMPYKDLAIETLRKLIDNEIHGAVRKNIIQERSFAAMLEHTISNYQKRMLDNFQVIDELIRLAKEMRDARNRGKDLGLDDNEVAFYDALCVNESAVRELGNEELKKIARELVHELKKSTTVDWTIRESVQAELRIKVKNTLRHHNYPPDLEEKATTTVLEQAEVLCSDWAGEQT
jgi:type I restriction enzyme R subunit